MHMNMNGGGVIYHEIERAVMAIISEGGKCPVEANQPMNINVSACSCDISATKRTRNRAKEDLRRHCITLAKVNRNQVSELPGNAGDYKYDLLAAL